MDKSKPQSEEPGFSSSATGIFGKATSSTAPSSSEDDLLKSLMSDSVAPAEAAPLPEPVAPASPEPGEFTRMFQALKPEASVRPPSPSVDKPAATKPPADLTNVFTPVNLNKPRASAPAGNQSQPDKPGEFTQLLQTLTRPVAGPEPGQARAPVAEASAPMPGSFTQMFQAISSEKLAESAAPSTDQAVPPPQAAAAGGFTQIFQALSESTRESVPSVVPEPPAAPASQSGTGSFTQIFQQLNAQPQPQSDSFAFLKQEPAPQTPANFYGTNPAPQEPVVPAQGGFTQLFQALGKENAPSREPGPFAPLPPQPPSATPPAAGGFTQLLQTLNAGSASPQTTPTPVIAPQTPPLPSPMPASSGPGEFTRIISGSMLREAQTQEGTTASSSPVMPPTASPGSGQAAFQIPKIPQAMQPQFPHMPQVSMHGGGGAAPQMPHFQPSAFPFPQPPAAPVPQPPAPGKLQQYLPLLLVLNIFVLLIVVLIVVFVLRHH